MSSPRFGRLCKAQFSQVCGNYWKGVLVDLKSSLVSTLLQVGIHVFFLLSNSPKVSQESGFLVQWLVNREYEDQVHLCSWSPSLCRHYLFLGLPKSAQFSSFLFKKSHPTAKVLKAQRQTIRTWKPPSFASTDVTLTWHSPNGTSYA